MAGLIGLIGLALIILGIVALFKPLPKLQLGSRKRAGLAIVLGIVLAIVSAAISPVPVTAPGDPAAPAAVPAGGDGETGQAAQPQRAAATGAAIGTPIRDRDAEITITSVETRNRVGIEYMYENASEGGTLVVVNYTIRNAGDRPLKFYSPAIRLIDPAGVEYSADIAKSAAYSMEVELNDKVISDLNPGITTRGAEVFEVAADRYDPATWQVTVAGKRNRVAIQ